MTKVMYPKMTLRKSQFLACLCLNFTTPSVTFSLLPSYSTHPFNSLQTTLLSAWRVSSSPISTHSKLQCEWALHHYTHFYSLQTTPRLALQVSSLPLHPFTNLLLVLWCSAFCNCGWCRPSMAFFFFRDCCSNSLLLWNTTLLFKKTSVLNQDNTSLYGNSY